jgi:acyl phosphate:glycerol-3-phosphate acyltransferase
MWIGAVFIVIAAYLLGSLPQLKWLAGFRGLSLFGDYHELLWNGGGKALAIFGIITEFLKGVIPVLAARGLGYGDLTAVSAGVAAVCGQMWPVFAKFDGEKGNSIGFAMLVTLNFIPAATALILPVLAIIIRTVPRLLVKSQNKTLIGGPYSRAMPLGMLLYFLAQPLLNRAMGYGPVLIWGTAVLFVLIMVRRATAGLTGDLKSGQNIKQILLNRLLYDRAATPWRQNA